MVLSHQGCSACCLLINLVLQEGHVALVDVQAVLGLLNLHSGDPQLWQIHSKRWAVCMQQLHSWTWLPPAPALPEVQQAKLEAAQKASVPHPDAAVAAVSSFQRRLPVMPNDQGGLAFSTSRWARKQEGWQGTCIWQQCKQHSVLHGELTARDYKHAGGISGFQTATTTQQHVMPSITDYRSSAS